MTERWSQQVDCKQVWKIMAKQLTELVRLLKTLTVCILNKALLNLLTDYEMIISHFYADSLVLHVHPGE